MLDINDDVGVRINKTFKSFVFAAGGYENLDFVERDVRNYVAQSSKNSLKSFLSHEGIDSTILLRHWFGRW